jgi:hypothetical protein
MIGTQAIAKNELLSTSVRSMSSRTVDRLPSELKPVGQR